MTFLSSLRRITPTVFIGLMNSCTRWRREQVLLDLVGDDAEAGLFDGEARQRLGVRRDRRGHGVDDGVDLRLGELGEDGLRALRAARQRARLGNRCEVFVGLAVKLSGSH